MARLRLSALALGLALAATAAAAPAPTDAEARDDEKVLHEAKVGTDPARLLAYLQERTPKEADPAELARLVRELGDEAFAMREAAFQRLADLGPVAMAGLKPAEADENPERRRRVAELKRRIDLKAEPTVQAAAIRTLARTRPAGAAGVLLGYAPFAGDAQVVDEIGKALGTLAVRGNAAEPALVTALAAPSALKRGLAGEGLARSGNAEQLPAVRKLLADADPEVRLRVALALALRKEREAVPVLVELLGTLNADRLWQAEELLVRLAGEQAPSVSLGVDEAGRKTARDAWHGWLAKQDKLDMSRVEESAALLGYTLVVQQHFNRGIGLAPRVGGEIVELDKSPGFNPRWRFNVGGYPVDAQVVGPDRVLVAEYQAGRVSEYSTKGVQLWQKPVNGNPIGVQRLPTGNTFVVMQNRLLELTPQGETAFEFSRPQHDIMRARKLRGEVVYVTNQGNLVRMDAKTQKTLSSYNVGHVQVLFGNLDLLPNGHVLIPEFQNNRVVEYDNAGRQVATLQAQWPNSAVRLPNGNTLIASQNARRITEYDRNGRQLWTHPCDGAVFNARRR